MRAAVGSGPSSLSSPSAGKPTTITELRHARRARARSAGLGHRQVSSRLQEPGRGPQGNPRTWVLLLLEDALPGEPQDRKKPLGANRSAGRRSSPATSTTSPPREQAQAGRAAVPARTLPNLEVTRGAGTQLPSRPPSRRLASLGDH